MTEDNFSGNSLRKNVKTIQVTKKVSHCYLNHLQLAKINNSTNNVWYCFNFLSFFLLRSYLEELKERSTSQYVFLYFYDIKQIIHESTYACSQSRRILRQACVYEVNSLAYNLRYCLRYLFVDIYWVSSLLRLVSVGAKSIGCSRSPKRLSPSYHWKQEASWREK